MTARFDQFFAYWINPASAPAEWSRSLVAASLVQWAAASDQTTTLYSLLPLTERIELTQLALSRIEPELLRTRAEELLAASDSVSGEMLDSVVWAARELVAVLDVLTKLTDADDTKLDDGTAFRVCDARVDVGEMWFRLDAVVGFIRQRNLWEN